MAKLYRNKQGEKLYPVCSWERNQHKIYNALTRAMNDLYDAEEDKSVTTEEYNRLLDRKEQIEEALAAFDRYVIGPTVYATYKESCIIKDLIGAYDVRHDMKGDWKSWE